MQLNKDDKSVLKIDVNDNPPTQDEINTEKARRKKHLKELKVKVFLASITMITIEVLIICLFKNGFVEVTTDVAATSIATIDIATTAVTTVAAISAVVAAIAVATSAVDDDNFVTPFIATAVSVSFAVSIATDVSLAVVILFFVAAIAAIAIVASAVDDDNFVTPFISAVVTTAVSVSFAVSIATDVSLAIAVVISFVVAVASFVIILIIFDKTVYLNRFVTDLNLFTDMDLLLDLTKNNKVASKYTHALGKMDREITNFEYYTLKENATINSTESPEHKEKIREIYGENK